MIVDAVQCDETQRLNALYQLQILDTEPDQAFDELVELAASVCEVPIALISLVDESRQWFKARVGLEVAQTDRSSSFCSHAIRQDEMLVVEDAREDSRFASSPLVRDKPHIRFYAGSQLLTCDGHGLGALCVIDRKPRQLSEYQKNVLSILSRQAMTILEVRYKNRLLTQCTEELASFNYAVSHDLQSPVRRISGYGHLLEDELEEVLTADARDFLQSIQDSTDHMSELIEGFLGLSEVTRAEMTLTRFNPGEIVCHLGAALNTDDPVHKVELVVNDDSRVFADRTLVQILLDNLLRNAWKFTRGKESPRVEFGVDASGPVPVYYVSDNGAGFDQQAADEKLFQPFQRLHLERDFPGNGIGLSTVKRIVNRHGGRIWAEGAVGQGATFRFTLR